MGWNFDSDGSICLSSWIYLIGASYHPQEYSAFHLNHVSFMVEVMWTRPSDICPWRNMDSVIQRVQHPWPRSLSQMVAVNSNAALAGYLLAVCEHVLPTKLQDLFSLNESSLFFSLFNTSFCKSQLIPVSNLQTFSVLHFGETCRWSWVFTRYNSVSSHHNSGRCCFS